MEEQGGEGSADHRVSGLGSKCKMKSYLMERFFKEPVEALDKRLEFAESNICGLQMDPLTEVKQEELEPAEEEQGEGEHPLDYSEVQLASPPCRACTPTSPTSGSPIQRVTIQTSSPPPNPPWRVSPVPWRALLAPEELEAPRLSPGARRSVIDSGARWAEYPPSKRLKTEDSPDQIDSRILATEATSLCSELDNPLASPAPASYTALLPQPLASPSPQDWDRPQQSLGYLERYRELVGGGRAGGGAMPQRTSSVIVRRPTAGEEQERCKKLRVQEERQEREHERKERESELHRNEEERYQRGQERLQMESERMKGYGRAQQPLQRHPEEDFHQRQQDERQRQQEERLNQRHQDERQLQQDERLHQRHQDERQRQQEERLHQRQLGYESAERQQPPAWKQEDEGVHERLQGCEGMAGPGPPPPAFNRQWLNHLHHLRAGFAYKMMEAQRHQLGRGGGPPVYRPPPLPLPFRGGPGLPLGPPLQGPRYTPDLNPRTPLPVPRSYGGPSSTVTSEQTSPSGQSPPPLPPDTSSQPPEPLTKGKRGRPRKHAPKLPLPPLYVFIRNMLHSPAYNPSTVAWVDEIGGCFKVTSTTEFAKTWGRMKSNRSEEMNYEKMSRAMRYHYGCERQGRKGHLAMVKEKRLYYKFGELARNWRAEEVAGLLRPCATHPLCRSSICLWTKE